MLQSNCVILDQKTISYYGLADASLKNAGCYINQNHQNQFIIILGSQYDKANILQIPNIVSNQVLNYSNGQTNKVLSVQSNQIKLLNQLNQMSKSCYFQNNQNAINLSNKKPQFTFASQSNINISCNFESQQQADLIFKFTCTSSSLKLDLTTYTQSTQTTKTIQAVCTNIFQIETKDKNQITLSADSVNFIKIINLVPLPNNYYFNTQLSTQFIVQSDIKTGFNININSYSQIFTPFSTSSPIQVNSYPLTIAPYTVTQETQVEIKVEVYDTKTNLKTVQYYYINYQSHFKLSIFQNTPITNFNLSQNLTLNAQVVDSNYDNNRHNLIYNLVGMLGYKQSSMLVKQWKSNCFQLWLLVGYTQKSIKSEQQLQHLCSRYQKF
ncbi:hypothetical protein ABPG72_014121 [Tetrahymena utriculariae]